MNDVMRCCAVFCFSFGILVTPAAADEAVTVDGRRLAGTASVGADGRLRFAPEASFREVLFKENGADRPLRSGMALQVRLADGGSLTAELVAVQKDSLRLRTAWAERFEMSSAAVASLEQLAGWQTIVFDDCRDGSGWTRSGPAVAGGVFDRTGQEWSLAAPAGLAAGRVGVNFEAHDAAVARWVVACEFESSGGRRTVEVEVVGAGDVYRVTAAGISGGGPPVKRTPGPHRLSVQWSTKALRVLCDNEVVWYSPKAGPGGPLRAVRLFCGGDKETAKGEVVFSAFAVARADEQPPRPTRENERDEFWTVDGDQWFGTLKGGDLKSATLENPLGTRTLPWTELRGLVLKRGARTPRTTDGQQVRVSFDGGGEGGMDVLEGVVTKLDAAALTLLNPCVGEVRLPRSRLRKLQPLWFGKRVEVETGLSRLTEQSAAWRRTVRLDAPVGGRLTVELANREKGPVRVEVVINGKAVGFLEPGVRRCSLELAAALLRAGDNTIELKQTGVGACEVANVALELPR